MPLDGIFLHFLCGELQALVGTRVDKIHHPAKDELVFHMRGRGGSHKLLLCANPSRARAGIVMQGIENPAQPSMLCMLLRKHFTGAVLTKLSQPGLERSLRFDFRGTNEIGEPTQLALRADFTGRHANLTALREDGTALGALRQVEPAKPQGKHNLLEGPPAHPPPPEPEALVAAYEGISPLVARELCWRTISAASLLNQNIAPYLYRNAQGIPAQFSYMPITHLGPGEKIESFSRLLELFYDEKDRLERTRQRTAQLLKLCETRAARARRKVEAQRAELVRAQDREHLLVCGELILANRAQLEQHARGSSAYRLENYYDENRPIVINADPALSPGTNAQRYFKLYRKAKTAAELLGGLIKTGEAEARYLDSVADLLLRAEGQAEIDALRAELEAQGYVKSRAAKKQVKPKALRPLEYQSAEGFRILAGRSNTQNDQLSFQTARGGDLWFHAKDYPGSHVILCTEGRTPGEQSIYQAAMVAAWHSKARGRAVIDYTPAKTLKKLAGAPPGQVIYHTHQSIVAAPTRALVDSLLRGEPDGCN